LRRAEAHKFLEDASHLAAVATDSRGELVYIYKFSNVSLLLDRPYKITMERTFESLCIYIYLAVAPRASTALAVAHVALGMQQPALVHACDMTHSYV